MKAFEAFQFSANVLLKPTHLFLFAHIFFRLQFVIIFAASMRRPGFYHMDSDHDPILIGQLYYLNFYALFMGYVWTMMSGVEIFEELMAWAWICIGLPCCHKLQTDCGWLNACATTADAHTHTQPHTTTHTHSAATQFNSLSLCSDALPSLSHRHNVYYSQLQLTSQTVDFRVFRSLDPGRT